MALQVNDAGLELSDVLGAGAGAGGGAGGGAGATMYLTDGDAALALNA